MKRAKLKYATSQCFRRRLREGAAVLLKEACWCRDIALWAQIASLGSFCTTNLMDAVTTSTSSCRKKSGDGQLGQQTESD